MPTPKTSSPQRVRQLLHLGLVRSEKAGARRLRDLLAAVEPRTSPLPQRFELLWHRVAVSLRRVATSRFAAIVTGTLLVLQALGAALVLIVLGFSRWRTGDRRAALEWLQRSALTSLLITSVFQFAASQFAAIAGLAVDLLLLGVVGSALRARAASGEG